MEFNEIELPATTDGMKSADEIRMEFNEIELPATTDGMKSADEIGG